jgi:outer membrane protein assembly complex protein YaeT
LGFTPVAVLSACAQENQYEGLPITAVRLSPDVQSALHPLDLSAKLSSLNEGATLRMADVRSTIAALYSSGRFDDVAVEAELENGGVAITLNGKLARFVREVEVSGADEPPSRGQLVNATNLQLGYEYIDYQIRQSVEGLLEALRTNGFYLAKVAPDTAPQPQQQIDFHFFIETGKRASYSLPVLRGDYTKTPREAADIARWKGWWGWGPWRSVTDQRTQNGLDRIRRDLQKRDFLMAQVALEQMEYSPESNRVVPVVRVDRGPKVEVKTNGFDLSRGKLRELLPIYQELAVDRDLLNEGQREIREYLQSKGYFDAAVEFNINQPAPDLQAIEYNIVPGERHKLVHIDVTGNNYFDDGSIRERLITTTASFLRYRRGRLSEDYLQRDREAIRSLYETNGFRSVEVETRVIDNYRGKLNEVSVVFEINEGPQWFVSDLTIEGVTGEEEEFVRSLLQSLEGQPYSELNVSFDQDTVLSYYFNNGYPDATFEPFASPAAEANRMQLRYVINPGERQFVRDVLISGLRTTDQELVLERIRNLQPGQPLAQSSMIESQRRLYDLGIFARVDTALQNPGGDTDHKYVLYRFEEARRYSLTGGIGAQIARIGRGRPSLDTPAGAPGFSPRVSLGISRSNFLGVGHVLSLQSRWSNIQRRFLLSYLAPQFKGYEEISLSFTGLYDFSRDVQTFTSRRQEGSVQLSQRLTRANTMQYRVAYRRVTVSDLSITPALIPLFSQPVQLGTISATFIQDRRDEPVDAQKGIYNTVDGAYASNFGISPRTNFSRLLARNATYHRMGRDFVLARLITFGAITRQSPAEVPLPERFFAGGAASHRGFPDNQAGPRDLLTGFPLGGNALLVNTVELRFPFIGTNIGGVLFHDAGNVYSGVDKISFRVNQRGLQDFNYMVHAVGFGVRYRTPIGPVRLDLAWSINSPRFVGLQGSIDQLLDPNFSGQPVEQRINQFQFHFSLGQLF